MRPLLQHTLAQRDTTGLPRVWAGLKVVPGAIKLIRDAGNAEDRLRIAIEDAPEAFKRPRSQVLHGIRCGYQQNAGRLEWDNPNRVCDLIRKHFAEDESALIRTSETPNRKGLAERSAADLKRLGVRIVGAGDQVLIKPVDSELERMVDALLQEAREEGDQAA